MEQPVPRLVAWESTRACNLACVHCRAEAQFKPSPGELTTAEIKRVVGEIGEFARPIFIITGGEPLMREDVFDVASFATARGLRVVMSPNGTFITPDVIKRMKDAGVTRISVSLDGSCPERHDSFRMVRGAFEAAVRGLAYAREGGLPFQVNTTVSRRNLDDLPAMLTMVAELGAVTWDVFMLVPTGRGKVEDEVTPQQYEQVLNWIYRVSRNAPLQVKVTCGPHYMRVWRQQEAAARRAARIAGEGAMPAETGSGGSAEGMSGNGDPAALERSGREERDRKVGGRKGCAEPRPGGNGGGAAGHGGSRPGGERAAREGDRHPEHAGTRGVHPGPHPGGKSRGCMAGNGFCFISHVGEVYPCGYLPLSAGNVRDRHFREIYQESALFCTLRDVTRLGGKCGRCEFRMVCYGCRARAYSQSGDYMGEEPFCLYEPRSAAR